MEIELINAFPLASVAQLGTPKKEITAKPNVTLSICFIIAIIMLFISSTMRILGIIILALTLFAFSKYRMKSGLAFMKTA